MTKTAKLKIDDHALVLKMNFKVMGELQEDLGINMLEGQAEAQKIIQPKNLPRALWIMAGKPEDPSYEQIAEALTIDNLEDVSEALKELYGVKKS